MANQASYTSEFKVHVVMEALETSNIHDRVLVAQKYGISSNTLLGWMRRYEEYGEAGLTARTRSQAEREKRKELEKRVAELEEENEILKKAAAFLAEVGRK